MKLWEIFIGLTLYANCFASLPLIPEYENPQFCAYWLEHLGSIGMWETVLLGARIDADWDIVFEMHGRIDGLMRKIARENKNQ